MARPARPWFRFYVEALSDRKLRRLDPAQRWLWVAVLGAARQSPISGYLLVSEREPMHAADLADIAGMSVKDVERTLPVFERQGMLTMDGAIGAWCVTNWSERQYESDNVTERTRKHRSKEQNGNVPTPFPGTPPETEAETETETPPTPRFKNVLMLAVQRDYEAARTRGVPIASPKGWKNSTYERLRTEQGERLTRLLVEFDRAPDDILASAILGDGHSLSHYRTVASGE